MKSGGFAFRKRVFLVGCLSATVIAGALPAGGAHAAERPELRRLLTDGLSGKESLANVNRLRAAARRRQPKEPAVDYAYGLVMLKRKRLRQAVAAFRLAVRKAPDYLPAWQALLRTHLDEDDKNPLLADAKKMAAAVSQSRDSDGSASGAEFLGRTVAFLQLASIDILPDGKVKELDAALQRRLGASLLSHYEQGKSRLLADHKKLKAEVDRDLAKLKQTFKQKTEKKLSNLEERKTEAKQKQENLKLTAAQWQKWMEEQKSKAEKDFKELQKDFKTLQAADARVARLATQTNIEMGRLRTRLALRGIRGRQADMQPAVLRLEQEATRYAGQRLQFRRRAAGLRVQARRLVAGYVAATQQYRQATGKIVKDEGLVKRWQKALNKSSEKIKDKQPSKTRANQLQDRLTRVDSFFELDYDAEVKRLLQANASRDVKK